MHKVIFYLAPSFFPLPRMVYAKSLFLHFAPSPHPPSPMGQGEDFCGTFGVRPSGCTLARFQRARNKY